MVKGSTLGLDRNAIKMSPKKDLKIVTFNIEGFSKVKASILAKLEAGIICLQETHRETHPPAIPGMHLAVDTPSRTYGSSIFVRDKAFVVKTEVLSHGNMELLKMETPYLDIISVYKPPNELFNWPPNLDITSKTTLVLGDFNSHSTLWGYDHDDPSGEEVILWASANDLTLLYDPKSKPTFLSGRWRKGYNPDLVFISSARSSLFKRTVMDHIPKSQHRPILVESQPALTPMTTKHQPRFNLRKANWQEFTNEIENSITNKPHTVNDYNIFTKILWKAAKRHIPRGCRKNYIAGLTNQTSTMYEEYSRLYNEDPFNQDTIDLGNIILNHLNEEKRARWQECIENTDMTHNSKDAWKTINKLNTINQPPQRISAVTPNQIAHQLILNGKPPKNSVRRRKQMKIQLQQTLQQDDGTQIEPFTLSELKTEIKQLKPNKAAGIDGIPNEFLKHLGPKALRWLQAFYQDCLTTSNTPKDWQRTRAVALLKPNKDATNPKSYRIISLLCTTYKLYERLILNRNSSTIKSQFTHD